MDDLRTTSAPKAEPLSGSALIEKSYPKSDPPGSAFRTREHSVGSTKDCGDTIHRVHGFRRRLRRYSE